MLWSIAGIFIKLIPWNGMVIAGVRSLLAALTVGGYMLITKKKFIFNKKGVVSAIFMCAAFCCFVLSNQLTSAANAIVLEFTSPIFIMIFSALFKKQRYKGFDIISMLLTLFGLVLFTLDGLESGNVLGNFVGLMAGVFMAGIYLAVGECEGDEKMSGILCGHILTALVGIPFVFFTHSEFTPISFLFIVILGVFQLGIPYILLGLASLHCPPLALNLLSAVEPIMSPVLVAIFAHEYPSVLSVIGGVIVVFAVTARCIMQSKN